MRGSVGRNRPVRAAKIFFVAAVVLAATVPAYAEQEVQFLDAGPLVLTASQLNRPTTITVVVSEAAPQTAIRLYAVGAIRGTATFKPSNYQPVN